MESRTSAEFGGQQIDRTMSTPVIMDPPKMRVKYPRKDLVKTVVSVTEPAPLKDKTNQQQADRKSHSLGRILSKPNIEPKLMVQSWKVEAADFKIESSSRFLLSVDEETVTVKIDRTMSPPVIIDPPKKRRVKYSRKDLVKTVVSPTDPAATSSLRDENIQQQGPEPPILRRSARLQRKKSSTDRSSEPAEKISKNIRKTESKAGRKSNQNDQPERVQAVRRSARLQKQSSPATKTEKVIAKSKIGTRSRSEQTIDTSNVQQKHATIECDLRMPTQFGDLLELSYKIHRSIERVTTMTRSTFQDELSIKRVLHLSEKAITMNGMHIVRILLALPNLCRSFNAW